ncbi:MAG: MBOAT family O-acyltransferase, partial [Anaerovoracaceae bacterium]|nr:MBOAT family O-acyltransferase [Anaerovoracaceae bacterium]
FESVSTPLAWLGVIAFSMQLYFDFWGYSVMARGLGEMLGIPIMRNFNHPYMSVSVSEYYRRWHISLGRWFREYIYIPMGGNRKGNARHIANLFFVWLLTGIWHGTTANFIIWAGVLFILIILEKKVYGDFLERHRCLGHIYIYSVIPLTWAVFAVENTGELAAFFSRLFPFGNPDALMIADALHYGPSYIWVAVLAAAVSLPKTEMLFEKYKGSVWMQAGMFVLMWICIWLIATGSGNAFMYARF